MASDTLLGTTLCEDRIGKVGLYLTHARERDTTIREDQVDQKSLGLYALNQTPWLDKRRAVLGWREDFYKVRVDRDTAANSGSASAHTGGPKATLASGLGGTPSSTPTSATASTATTPAVRR